MQPFSDQKLNDIPVRYDFIDSLLHILNGRMAAIAKNNQILRFAGTATLNRDNVMHN